MNLSSRTAPDAAAATRLGGRSALIAVPCVAPTMSVKLVDAIILITLVKRKPDKGSPFYDIDDR
jgi:hypothetical protein